MNYRLQMASALAIGLALGLGATTASAADKPTLAFVVNGASDFWKAAEAGVKKAQGELPNFRHCHMPAALPHARWPGSFIDGQDQLRRIQIPT